MQDDATCPAGGSRETFSSERRFVGTLGAVRACHAAGGRLKPQLLSLCKRVRVTRVMDTTNYQLLHSTSHRPPLTVPHSRVMAP